MKNGLLIWNIVLTLVAGYLLISHFSEKKPAVVSPAKSVLNDSAHHGNFRIAYFDMDSVENNFQMVKDMKAEIDKRERAYNNDLAKLDYAYKSKYESYQQKASTMSKDDYEKAKIDLKQLEEQLKGQKQELDQEYQDFVMHRQLSLKATIGDYLKEFNKSKDYSYIIVYTGDLVYYKDTAYDITHEVINGLNEKYRQKK